MTAAKQAGTKFESDLVAYLRGERLPAERLARTGAKDEGDVSLAKGGWTFILEAKARREKTTPLSIGAWLAEAHVEAENYAKAREFHVEDVTGILVVKRPNKSIGQSYVIMTLDDFLEH